MEGRFKKIKNLQGFKPNAGGRLYCNLENPEKLFEILYSSFGSPNGNSLKPKDSQWQYILEYQKIYLTIYPMGTYWNLGFLEQENIIPDYEVIEAVSRMLYEYLSDLLSQYTDFHKLVQFPSTKREKRSGRKKDTSNHSETKELQKIKSS